MSTVTIADELRREQERIAARPVHHPDRCDLEPFIEELGTVFPDFLGRVSREELFNPLVFLRFAQSAKIPQHRQHAPSNARAIGAPPGSMPSSSSSSSRTGGDVLREAAAALASASSALSVSDGLSNALRAVGNAELAGKPLPTAGKTGKDAADASPPTPSPTQALMHFTLAAAAAATPSVAAVAINNRSQVWITLARGVAHSGATLAVAAPVPAGVDATQGDPSQPPSATGTATAPQAVLRVAGAEMSVEGDDSSGAVAASDSVYQTLAYTPTPAAATPAARFLYVCAAADAAAVLVATGPAVGAVEEAVKGAVSREVSGAVFDVMEECLRLLQLLRLDPRFSFVGGSDGTEWMTKAKGGASAKGGVACPPPPNSKALHRLKLAVAMLGFGVKVDDDDDEEGAAATAGEGSGKSSDAAVKVWKEWVSCLRRCEVAKAVANGMDVGPFSRTHGEASGDGDGVVAVGGGDGAAEGGAGAAGSVEGLLAACMSASHDVGGGSSNAQRIASAAHGGAPSGRWVTRVVKSGRGKAGGVRKWRTLVEWEGPTAQVGEGREDSPPALHTVGHPTASAFAVPSAQLGDICRGSGRSGLPLYPARRGVVAAAEGSDGGARGGRAASVSAAHPLVSSPNFIETAFELTRGPPVDVPADLQAPVSASTIDAQHVFWDVAPPCLKLCVPLVQYHSVAANSAPKAGSAAARAADSFKILSTVERNATSRSLAVVALAVHVGALRLSRGGGAKGSGASDKLAALPASDPVVDTLTQMYEKVCAVAAPVRITQWPLAGLAPPPALSATAGAVEGAVAGAAVGGAVAVSVRAPSVPHSAALASTDGGAASSGAAAAVDDKAEPHATPLAAVPPATAAALSLLPLATCETTSTIAVAPAAPPTKPGSPPVPPVTATTSSYTRTVGMALYPHTVALDHSCCPTAHIVHPAAHPLRACVVAHDSTLWRGYGRDISAAGVVGEALAPSAAAAGEGNVGSTRVRWGGEVTVSAVPYANVDTIHGAAARRSATQAAPSIGCPCKCLACGGPLLSIWATRDTSATDVAAAGGGGAGVTNEPFGGGATAYGVGERQMTQQEQLASVGGADLYRKARRLFLTERAWAQSLPPLSVAAAGEGDVSVEKVIFGGARGADKDRLLASSKQCVDTLHQARSATADGWLTRGGEVQHVSVKIARALCDAKALSLHGYGWAAPPTGSPALSTSPVEGAQEGGRGGGAAAAAGSANGAKALDALRAPSADTAARAQAFSCVSDLAMAMRAHVGVILAGRGVRSGQGSEGGGGVDAGRAFLAEYSAHPTGLPVTAVLTSVAQWIAKTAGGKKGGAWAEIAPLQVPQWAVAMVGLGDLREGSEEGDLITIPGGQVMELLARLERFVEQVAAVACGASAGRDGLPQLRQLRLWRMWVESEGLTLDAVRAGWFVLRSGVVGPYVEADVEKALQTGGDAAHSVTSEWVRKFVEGVRVCEEGAYRVMLWEGTGCECGGGSGSAPAALPLCGVLSVAVGLVASLGRV